MARWSDKPWERQKGESTKAFEAFECYLKMGSGRTLHKVALTLAKSDTLIKRWSYTWNWIERIRNYENELKRQEIEEQRSAIKKMQERHIQTAMLMQKIAVKALDKVDPDALLPKDVIRLIAEGTKLERENRFTRDLMDDEKDQIIFRMEVEDMDSIEKDVYDEDE